MRGSTIASSSQFPPDHCSHGVQRFEKFDEVAASKEAPTSKKHCVCGLFRGRHLYFGRGGLSSNFSKRLEHVWGARELVESVRGGAPYSCRVGGGSAAGYSGQLSGLGGERVP